MTGQDMLIVLQHAPLILLVTYLFLPENAFLLRSGGADNACWRAPRRSRRRAMMLDARRSHIFGALQLLPRLKCIIAWRWSTSALSARVLAQPRRLVALLLPAGILTASWYATSAISIPRDLALGRCDSAFLAGCYITRRSTATRRTLIRGLLRS